MRVLQLDVDRIEFELMEPEASVYEKTQQKKVLIEDTLALFVSVEAGDTEAMASKAVVDAVEFCGKLKRQSILIYPFAHLSSDLEAPQRAMNLFNYMVKEAEKSGLGIEHAPFGWNKKLSLNIKGHPLAEMSRSYGGNAPKKTEKKKVDLSIVRKSDWSDVPDTDHRKIAERLDLFSFQEVSPGMVYWHNNGYVILKELVSYIRRRLAVSGYNEISTPTMANTALWHVSGHIDHYRENMFIMEANGQEVGLRPMGCPFAILVYKSKKRSYRDLPLRLAEFDKLYRNEISGALSGLFRVRELTQDDAHLFVTEAQIEKELVGLLSLVNEFYSKFGLEYKAKLSTMPDDHMGDENLWKKATDSLKNALGSNGIKYEIKEKEGAFYGPKIDIDVKDSMGREWQCATIQLDYQLPERFGLGYAGEDGREHTPVIIHRVIYGSLERFIGILTEHYQGRFPTWIAPVQAAIIPISEQTKGYGKRVFEEIAKSGIRAVLDDSDKTLNYKIKAAQEMKIPYMIILGKREEDTDTVSVRARDGGQSQSVKLESFLKSLADECRQD
jgi:threonyl-tRNA synthetase